MANRECAAARPLLQVLAFFAPGPLPREVLDSQSTMLPEGLDDELKRDEAIAALHRFSLIQVKAGTLIVHRLVQSADLSCPLPWAIAAIAIIDAAFPAQCTEVTRWPQCNQLSPHAEAALEVVTEPKFPLGTDISRIRSFISCISRLLDRLTSYLRALGSFNSAETLLRQSIEQRRAIAQNPLLRALGSDLESAQCLLDLAIIYHAKGLYDKARDSCEDSLKIREAKLGLEDPETATSQHYLARIERNIGKANADEHYANAESLFKQARKIREARELNAKVADTLNSMAALYRYQGRFPDAESLVERALEIRRNLFPQDDLEIAHCLNHLGLIFFGMGIYSESETNFKNALSIREKLLGEEHYEVATTLHDMAELYRSQHYFEKAVPLYKRALAIRAIVLGSTNELTLKTRDALAACKQSQDTIST